MRSFLLVGLSALALAACFQPSAQTPATDAAVAAVVAPLMVGHLVATDAGQRELTWTGGPVEGVRLEAVARADAARGTGRVLAEAATGGQFNWTPADPAAEAFVLVSAEGQAPVVTGLRLLPLEGGRNFRDLGGYATVDGGRVVWGQLYRSGVMNSLTTADYAYLGGRGIQVICDLRTESERTHEPTQWAAGPVETLTFADPERDIGSGLMAVFQDPEISEAKVAAAMAEGYRGILREQTPAYREMFARLLAGKAPLAFHCSAGKDRTGVGSALLLGALGVDRATVIADYVLSEQLVDFEAEFLGNRESIKPEDPYYFLTQLPVEVVRPLFGTRREYIEVMFNELETRHGGLEAYLATELGVGPDELAALRARYVTRQG
jgi:protein-tyrosine phosphatase